MVPPPDARVGTIIDGRYRIEETLGAGGMGVVYRAERVGIGKPVAIKFLQAQAASNAGFVRRFEREAKATSRLSHVHCVSLIDFGVADGAPYLVMELVAGRTLGELCAAGPIAPERAITIAVQVLTALRHAHSSGVVHRDLKPENVMLVEMTGARDFVKVLDFGLATLTAGAEGGSLSSLTEAGTAIGTPSYMSPEQIRGDLVDGRADLYALGVLLYEMVTGARPFTADDPLETLRRHLTQPPVAPRQHRPALSPALEAVILRALEKQPEARFETAEAFQRSLSRTPEGRRASQQGVAAAGDSAGASLSDRAAAVGGEVTAPQVRRASAERSGGAWRWLLVALAVGAIGLAAALPGARAWLRARRSRSAAAPAPPPAVAPAFAPAPPAASPPAAAPDPALREAAEQLDHGRPAAAVGRLLALRAKRPRDADVAALLARAFLARGWLSDGLAEAERAARLEPAAVREPRLVAALVAALAHPRVWERARLLLVERVGPAAAPALEALAREAPGPALRARAAATRDALRP